eukprot:2313153-Rhodomonas_salina.2
MVWTEGSWFGQGLSAHGLRAHLLWRVRAWGAGACTESNRPGSTIPELSTRHAVAPYPSSVPGTP